MTLEEQLRTKVELEFQRIDEALKAKSKSAYRSLHAPSVHLELEKAQGWIKQKYPKLANFIAEGAEVDPKTINPILCEVDEGWQQDLFRLARYTWSLPYTKGYGRRLRFLVLDNTNNKLIGIIGLQSPPLDFPARDKLFQYPTGKKVELVNQTMDIFTLGAIPPYNKLLAGKLVALAAASNEVRVSYEKKYSSRVTEIQKRILPATLVALTTTSAFGRSSIYNRLKYQDRLIAVPIGYTEGYGSFHLATIYPIIREILGEQGISTRGGFGVGPRIVWQTYIRAQQRLDLPKKILKHGIKREVFLFPLIGNLKEYMEGSTNDLQYFDQPFTQLANWWKKRWLDKRVDRMNGWHDWSKDEIRKVLFLEEGK